MERTKPTQKAPRTRAGAVGEAPRCSPSPSPGLPAVQSENGAGAGACPGPCPARRHGGAPPSPGNRLRRRLPLPGPSVGPGPEEAPCGGGRLPVPRPPSLPAAGCPQIFCPFKANGCGSGSVPAAGRCCGGRRKRPPAPVPGRLAARALS